jgi:hypothetical protein
MLSKIRTRLLSDPTLLSYYKWMNDRRTLSSIGCRSQTPKTIDPRQVVSEQGFRYYHRTATPLSHGRTSQSALSWQAHDQTNIESPVRRLARFSLPERISYLLYFLLFLYSAKCYHIEQKSQNPTDFDPVDRSLSYLRNRSASSSPALTTQNCTPTN